MPEPIPFGKYRENRDQMPPLQGGDGGGTFDPMLERVIKLEATTGQLQTSLTEVKSDTRDIRDRVIRLESDVRHLPSKGFIVTALLLSLGILGGVVTFANQIQMALGLK